jgi:ubiquinone/menaquinone biosynthesis C-methylase UbiE
VVTASLVLHYVEDWTTPLREAARVLRSGGLLLISTHHPTHDVEVSDPPAPYFETVLLTDTWRKGGRDFTVRFYHRPISAIVDALADAGFVIERIPEPVPDRAAFGTMPAFYERMIPVPWFLFIRASKRA